MTNGSIGEYGDIGGTAADIHQTHAQILLIVGKYGVAGGQLLQNDVVYLQAAALDAFDDILCGAHRPGNQVDLGLKTHT